MLELRSVTKVYVTGGLKHAALNRLSINFRANEFVAILGPSGSGKTTLLNIVGGLDHYTSGNIKINEVSTKKFRDKDWDAYRNHRIGFVFQNYNLIPHQTVLNNVKLALTLSGISKREAVRRAKDALDAVGLTEHIQKKPNQLSGGQMQRVAIARALVNDPEILLADEPTGALDSDTSIQIMDILKGVARDRLVIMVTHNPELADKYATRIVTLKDGKITSDSDPYDGKIRTKLNKSDALRKKRRTKMSFFTALSLSLKNLLTKKGRTVMVAFAGSIGIIGIALILAVSTGFQGYIDTVQADTLTSYPLYIRKDSGNMASALLGAALDTGIESGDGLIHENMILTKTLGSITTNDLKRFGKYIDNHHDEVADDLRLMENYYNVDPLIYSIDAVGDLAQLNPNTLFTALMGNSSLLSSYSAMTSVYRQYDKSLLEDDMRVLSGRMPEKYDELVIVLAKEDRIADLVTYSLGLRNTKDLTSIVNKIMNNEGAKLDTEPLTLTYEDLMNVDLRLVAPTDIYQYNPTYDLYEDMTGDVEYMRNVYASSEKLKIVGVVIPKDDLVTATSGVAYLPELVTHIIEKSAKTEIVKKQLANPSIDIFSNTEFASKKTGLDLSFEDLVSVDTGRIEQAFSFNLDEQALKARTIEYITSAGKDIVAEIKEKVLALGPLIDTKLIETRDAIEASVTAIFEDETIDFSTMTTEEIRDLFETAIREAVEGVDYSEIKDQIASISIRDMIDAKLSGMFEYLLPAVAGSFSVDEGMLMSAFQLNIDEEELTRIFTAVFNKTEKTLASNLAMLGYQALDDPTYIAFYFSSFEGKTRFLKFVDGYNDMMRSYGQDSAVIEYSDTTGILMNSVKIIVDAVSYVLIAFVSISLIVSSIMIGIITYISVYERTKEIGILRAIGASKRNISSIFNAETFIVGLLSGMMGIGISYLLIPLINLVLHHFTGDIPLVVRLDPGQAVILVALSVVLTLIGGLIPARAAAKKDPVEALRSE